MGPVVVLLLLVGYASAEVAPSLGDVITSRDQTRLRELFRKTPIDSLTTAYYVSNGLRILGEQDNSKKQTCSYIQQHTPDSTSLDTIFYATSVDALFDCEVSYSSFEKSLKDSLNSERNVSELFYIVSSLTNIGSKVDQKLLSPSKLLDLAEQEESILSYGQAFLTASLLTDGDLTSLMDTVEDVAVQADESPTSLYFEGGIETTSTAITGIVRLGTRTGNRPTLSALQATLFGKYFLSIKYTETISEAFYVLQAVEALAHNKFFVPTGVTLVNRLPINIHNQKLEVHLTNILNEPVPPSDVKLVTIESSSGDKDTINKSFTSESDGITYSYLLFPQVGSPGGYKVILSTEPKTDSPIAQLVHVELPVIVSFSVVVESAEISIIERDQNVAVKTVPLQYPTTSQDNLSADQHSKVKMTFQLLNKQNKEKVNVHQTFVRLVSAHKEEIYFVATPTNIGIYTFELDLADAAKEFFNSQSGTYEMSLIVGGMSVENPFSWDIGSLNLKFPGTPQDETSEELEYRYKPRPEIQHLFRAPEKRPPTVVSFTFAILVMAPVVLLVPVWLLLGGNILNITVSGPWAIIFHIGLIGIFGLYYLFWVQLNMFQTLKYLIILGGVTFISGNRMLRQIAKYRSA